MIDHLAALVCGIVIWSLFWFFRCFVDFMANWLVCELTALMCSELCNLPLSHPRMECNHGHYKFRMIHNWKYTFDSSSIHSKGAPQPVLNKLPGILPPPPSVDRDFIFTPHCLSVCLSVCLWARYLKWLWTDSDETWWTDLVADRNELIRFWWRSASGYSGFLKWFFTIERYRAKNDI